MGDDPRVDLLTLAWSVRYADAAPRMLTTRLDDVDVPYADLDTLIRTKQTAGCRTGPMPRRWRS